LRSYYMPNTGLGVRHMNRSEQVIIFVLWEVTVTGTALGFTYPFFTKVLDKPPL
jgi:hypothetical protein